MKGSIVEHPQWGRGIVRYVWPDGRVYVYTKHIVWQNPSGEYGYYSDVRELHVTDAVTLLGELAS